MNYPNQRQFIWIAITAGLTALAQITSSIAALVVAMRTTEKVTVVEEKIEQVHLATNSMKDALVASTRKESLLEGRAVGEKAGRAAGRVAGIAEEKAASIADRKRSFWK